MRVFGRRFFGSTFGVASFNRPNTTNARRRLQAVKLPKQKQQECVEDREEVGRSCVMDLELEPLQTCWVSGYTLSLDLVFERQGF